MTLEITWDDLPLADSDDPQRDLETWRHVMGTEYAGTPGTAAMDALEGRIKDTRSYTVAWRQPDQEWSRSAESPYTVRQYDRRGDDHHRFHHGYDVTRMYVTAAGLTEVSPWALRHSGKIEFDKRLAGWWLLDMSPWQYSPLPDPAGYARRNDATVRWVTTPTAKLLADLADGGVYAGFTVIDSYTGKGRRVFAEWQHDLESLYAHGGLLAATAKTAGRQAIGLLNSKTYSTYRPDWHYTIIAQARTNLFRKMWRAWREDRMAPLAVDTDCVWYGSDEAHPFRAAPGNFRFGDTPGCFKHKGTVAR